MKKLISANIVNQCYKDGLKNIYVEDNNTIITSEAKDLAKKFNIKFTNHCHSTSKPEIHKNEDCQNVIPTVVDKVISQLGNNSNVDKDSITAMVQNYLQKNDVDCVLECEPFKCERGLKGFKVVRGNSVKLSRFKEAGSNKNVQLTDVVTHQDGSPMSAGIMSWNKEDSFPWKLTYDEIDYVIDGELEITIDGKAFLGKIGDVFYIPKGSEIIFGTPNHTKIMYVTYPANWSE